MKKIISLLLALVLTLSLTLIFTSCDTSGEDNSKINLTLDNFEQYLTVSAKMHGTDGWWNSSWSEYRYEYITTSVEIASVSPLIKFYNCSVTIRVEGTWQYKAESDIRNHSEVFEIPLNIGGSGSASNDWKYFDNCDDHKNITGKSYQIVTVSGYVVID